MYADNTNEYNNTAWTALNRFQDQAYAWKDITETDNEPWHVRYVGDAAARFMTEHNLCLEEFVALYQ